MAANTAQPGRGGTAERAFLAAGVMLVISGPISILMGAAGIAQDSLLVITSHYAYTFDLTAWGVIHLVVGVALTLAGVAVLMGRSWGRWVGVVTVAISLITQFMFIPHYPAWAIPVMALDLAILFLLTRIRDSAPTGR